MSETTLRQTFTAEHREADSFWAEVEKAIDAGDKATAIDKAKAFDKSLRDHLMREEEIMFPAFERVTGMQGGPTFVMRSEHERMRAVLDQMAAAAAEGNLDALLDQGDTLMMLVQQHNMKEEGMLYPMAEQALDAEWPELLAKLESTR